MLPARILSDPDRPPVLLAQTASTALPAGLNLPGLGAIRLASLNMPLTPTEHAALAAVLTLGTLDNLVTARRGDRITHTFDGRHADGSLIPVTLVLDGTGTLRRMVLYAESDAAVPHARLDLHFGLPPMNAQWLELSRLPLNQQQRSAATVFVAHLEKNGVPVAQLELDAPWPQGPSDACLRELLWSLGARLGDTLQALAAAHGLTLARLSAAPRAVLVALLSGLADARQCLPLSLSELRLLPPRLSAPSIAQASAIQPTQRGQ